MRLSSTKIVLPLAQPDKLLQSDRVEADSPAQGDKGKVACPRPPVHGGDADGQEGGDLGGGEEGVHTKSHRGHTKAPLI